MDIAYRNPEPVFGVSATCLANKNCGEYIGIILLNSGKVNSGDIWIEPSYSNTKIFSRLSPKYSVSINSTSGIYTDIKLNQINCDLSEYPKCNKSNLPKGRYNLTITFNCDFCAPEQRKINMTIPLFIYQD